VVASRCQRPAARGKKPVAPTGTRYEGKTDKETTVPRSGPIKAQAAQSVSDKTSKGVAAPAADGFLRRRALSIIVVTVLLAMYFQFANTNFLTDANLQTLSQFIAPVAIIACGEIMLLICGEIDLSAGQVFALAPFLMHFAARPGLPPIAAVSAGLIGSGVIGLANGLITVRLHVPSFVTTLGTQFLLMGFALAISHGSPVETGGSEAQANFMGAGAYSEFIWALAVVTVMHFVLRYTRWGLRTIAVGGNLAVASEAGIHVERIKVSNFVLTSVLAGLTGILEAFRIGSADPLAGGTNIMFLAIAAGVIGGTPFAGGFGTITGGLAGAMVLAVLQDGFTLLGINAFNFSMITGAAILNAMVSNIHMSRLQCNS
jgi:simple sugar transport system permease protein